MMKIIPETHRFYYSFIINLIMHINNTSGQSEQALRLVLKQEL
jgi:hypothetical protein